MKKVGKSLLALGLVCLLAGCGGRMTEQAVEEANSATAEPMASAGALVTTDLPELETPMETGQAESEAATEVRVVIDSLQQLEELEDGLILRGDVVAGTGVGEIQPGYVYQIGATVTNLSAEELDLAVSTLIPSVFSEQEQALWAVSVTNMRTLEVWVDEVTVTATTGVVQLAGIANGYIGAFHEGAVELYCEDVLAPGESRQYYFLAAAEQLPDERAEALGYAVRAASASSAVE